MFPSPNKMENVDVEEILLLTNQLEGSEYYEDKYAALKQINDYASQNAFIVGVYALHSIINSMKVMDDIQMHKGIIEKIFRSRDKDVFIEILVQKEANIDVVFDRFRDIPNICKILARFDGPGIFNVIKGKTIMREIIENIEFSISFLHFFITDANKEYFIYEGLFEKIIEIINENNSKHCVKTIETLLYDSISCQDYFLELDWILHLKNFNIANIITILMNNKSKRLNEVQSLLSRNNLLYLNDKNFLRNFIHKNPKNLVKIEDMGFNIYKTLSELHEGNVNNLSILDLLNEIILFKKIDINKIDDSQFYFIVLSVIIVVDKEIILLQPQIEMCLYSLIQYSSISLERFYGSILLLILSGYKIEKSNFNILYEIYKNKEIDKNIRSLVILLIVSTTEDYDFFGFNHETVVSYLSYLRNNLSQSKFLLTEPILEFLYEKLNEKISKFSNRKHYYDEYNELSKVKSLEKILQNLSTEKLVKKEEIIVTEKKDKNILKNTLNNGKEKLRSFIGRGFLKKDIEGKDDVVDL